MFPKFLQAGSNIGITASARKISHTELQAATQWLQQQGYNVTIGNNIGLADNQFAGTDAQRLTDLQTMLNNPTLDAIWIAKGGYGTARFIDSLDYTQFVKHPKWIIGFSDITVLLNDIYSKTNIATIHAIMTTQIATNTPNSLQSLANLLAGNLPNYTAPYHPLNKTGNAKGVLIGGNLSVLCNSIGTKTDIDTTNKLLLLEDLDEYLYHIDRLMLHLDRAGKLANLAGLIVGSLTDMKDNEIPFGKAAEEIVHHYAAKYNYPIAFGIPIGHITDNRAIIIGAETQLGVDEKQTKLLVCVDTSNGA